MKAVDGGGNVSPLSEVLGGKTTDGPDAGNPGAVGNLAAGGATPTSLLLTWTASGDDGSAGRASGYDIRYSTSPITAGSFASATPLSGEPKPSAAGASESFLVTGLSPGTTYYFALRSSDELGNMSAMSNATSGATAAAGSDATAPGAIADLTLGYVTEESINLMWTTTGDDGATGKAARYDIRYSTSAINAGNFAGATQVSGAPVPYTAGYKQAVNVKGLQPNTTYYFAMKAIDDGGHLSGLSNVPSVKTGTGLDGSKIRLDASMLLNEGTFGDETRLVDEQELSGDPKNGAGGEPLTDYKVHDNQVPYYPGSILIDLGATYHLSDVYMRDMHSAGQIYIYAGDPTDWTEIVDTTMSGFGSWFSEPVDAITRYIRYVEPVNTSMHELVLYGSRLEDTQPPSPPEPVVPTRMDATPMDDFIGLNVQPWEPLELMEVADGFIRQYHAWWYNISGDSNVPGYPNDRYKFNPSFITPDPIDFDTFYQDMKDDGRFVFPTLHWGAPWMHANWHHKPVPTGMDPEDPASYEAHADYMFQYAARYGSTVVNDNLLKLYPDQPRESGMNLLHYFENWNEQNADWHDRESYFTPYEYAAMSSADYDGHLGTMPDTVGLKNADPNAKLVMSGTAGLQPGYLKAMDVWSDWHRGGSFPADVINFHLCACSPTGGVSPEAYNTREKVEELVKYRNTYLPDKEIWITEFGYDTNPASIQTVRYDEFDKPRDTQELQGQWLVRTYLALAAAGVDRAAMYMLADPAGSGSPIFWDTSGLTTSREEGYQPKKSYYYVYTLKNRLTGLHFHDEQPSGDPNVWIYRFADSAGTVKNYVLWSPTANEVTVDDYELTLSGNPSSATLVTMQNGDIDGVPSSLTITGGQVTVDVSERPIFVLVD